MPEPKCPRCGANLTETPQGDSVCPRCLIDLAVDDPDDVETIGTTGNDPGPEPLPGDTITHFTVVSRLGAGGVGAVFLAEDDEIPGRRVALKLLKKAGRIAGDLERLRQEASALAALQHPNILVVHEIGTSEFGPFLATEYLRGGTLARSIKQAPLPLDLALRYAQNVADAIAAAHESGIVHRDIKPANILLTEDEQVRVADFGLAFVLPTAPPGEIATQVTATRETTVAGTPGYISPEVLCGAKPGPRADQYAFGVMLHEMLSGRRPHEDRDWIAATMEQRLHLDESIPRDLTRLIVRCLSADPSARPSMQEIRQELQDAVRRRDPTRRRATLAVVGSLLLLFVAATAWQSHRWYRSQQAQGLHSEGIEALADDRRGDALRAFVAAHQADPSYEPACIALGVLGRDEMALAYLRTCAAAFPDSPEVLYNLGGALSANGETEEAEKTLESAREQSPDAALDPLILNELALLRIERGDAPSALSLLPESVLPDPRTLEGALLHRTRGLALVESGRNAEALEMFELAFSDDVLEDETRAAALVGWGRALEAEGDFPHARQYFSEALLEDADERTAEAARAGLTRLQAATSD